MGEEGRTRNLDPASMRGQDDSLSWLPRGGLNLSEKQMEGGMGERGREGGEERRGTGVGMKTGFNRQVCRQPALRPATNSFSFASITRFLQVLRAGL